MIFLDGKINIKIINEFKLGCEVIGEVIFVDETKILVKLDLEHIKADSNKLTRVIQLNVNEYSKGIKYKDRIEFDGIMAESKFGEKQTLICNPARIVILGKSTGTKHKSENKDFKKSDQAVEVNSKSSAVRFSLSQDQSKFLIPAGKANNYTKDDILEKFGRLIQVSHVGKAFSFKQNKNNGTKKSHFKDGDQVCYVYYYKKEPVFSADEFFQATKNYYEFIAYLKKNGVKPRHKAAEISDIKKSKALCDSRLKIEGNSWIALNGEYLWYITHKLSPITMDNNIKINNQFAQCWRISLHQISNKLTDLEKIDLVLFKSSAIPSAFEDETEDNDI